MLVSGLYFFDFGHARKDSRFSGFGSHSPGKSQPDFEPVAVRHSETSFDHPGQKVLLQVEETLESQIQPEVRGLNMVTQSWFLFLKGVTVFSC